MMSTTDVSVMEPSILGRCSPTASFLDRLDTEQRDELVVLATCDALGAGDHLPRG